MVWLESEYIYRLNSYMLDRRHHHHLDFDTSSCIISTFFFFYFLFWLYSLNRNHRSPLPTVDKSKHTNYTYGDVLHSCRCRRFVIFKLNCRWNIAWKKSFGLKLMFRIHLMRRVEELCCTECLWATEEDFFVFIHSLGAFTVAPLPALICLVLSYFAQTCRHRRQHTQAEWVKQQIKKWKRISVQKHKIKI